MNSRLTSITEFFRKIYFLAKPYGRKKLAIVSITILVQGVLQVAGVSSIFPFLAVATSPEQFRQSTLGGLLLGVIGEVDNTRLLLIAGIGSIIVLLVSNGVSLMSDLIKGRYAQGFGHWLRVKMFGEIVSQPWSYFLKNNSNLLLKKGAHDVIEFTNQVLMPTLEAASRLITVVFLVIALIVVDPFIALGVGSILVVFYGAVLAILSPLSKRLSDGLKVAFGGAIQEAQQLLSGIKPIKVALAELHFIDRYSKHSEFLRYAGARIPLIQNSPKYLLEPLAFGGLIAIVLWSSANGDDMNSLIPTLGVIGFAAYRLLPAAQILYGQISSICTMQHCLDEVYDEFHQIDELGSKPQHRIQVLDGSPQRIGWKDEIVLENLSFRYPVEGALLISNLSAVLPKNTSLGIVGPSGSGKSTLVDLILGLHQPTAGRILIDDAELSVSNRRSWLAGVGYVPQDLFLIDDTIARNIAFGVADKDIDQDRLREVAEAAQIRSFIEKSQSAGFETIVGDRGIRLSGGQRQRIALARALYSRPDLLVLDEATSALDHDTEAEIMKSLESLQGTITMIVIAHRLTTVEKCDQVLRLGAQGVSSLGSGARMGV